MNGTLISTGANFIRRDFFADDFVVHVSAVIEVSLVSYGSSTQFTRGEAETVEY